MKEKSMGWPGGLQCYHLLNCGNNKISTVTNLGQHVCLVGQTVKDLSDLAFETVEVIGHFDKGVNGYTETALNQGK